MIPLRDNVVVQLKERKTQTTSGLYIPDTAKESRITTGVAISVGSEVKQVKINDVVLLDVPRGTKLDNNQVIISEDKIFCILEKDADVQDINTDVANYLNA